MKLFTFKTPPRSHLLRLGMAVLGSLAGIASAQTTSGFAMAYNAQGTGYGISGQEPSAAGKYPVYVHIGGTGENYQSNWSMAAVNTAAAKGFVAASVQYDNGSFGDCGVIGSRARAIFDANSLSSAIAQLCSRDKADCSKGVVTGGMSQGSIISVLSHDYDNRIVASFGQGTGATYTPYYNLSACIADGNHSQSADRLRIIDGEHDMFVGGSESIARSQATLVTGLNCEGSQSCFRPNGSGWYIVKDSEVQDMYADHCFIEYGGMAGTQCSGALIDYGYLYGNAAWELNPTLDWLKRFVTP
ncbi:hypothetical protein [Xanthomonas graminis]|jgi:hypothetical protein|uniref:Uncharacterized protein n=1 Tax=Xanthomonas graminis pv. graminis TaxID=134874 RepID=A0A1M4J5S0_9XANT|nr:hypothetical protein [Xanthomonas translucens]EKU26120.1 hypothetical protein XTG29_00767 [Xanthomonas translucens pv. graminis ART-Xtg29]OAX61834.1 hypothetical protein A6R72_10865 [Xanthomonas translucens pv. graminis]UKE53583.1 hypothetical protein KFS84_14975 [Xanthomonas translucens pv. graminis]WIH07898.1 hypothetical protein KM579_15535 [Xanthomonas translucens pv. graminis]WIH13343.1 hypothetical protein KM563_06475 [Xanthomonas translucens pv. graminis]